MQSRVTIQRIDADHGNVLKEYAAMGSPLDPTPGQVEQLNLATALPRPEEARIEGGRLELSPTPNCLVLVKVEP